MEINPVRKLAGQTVVYGMGTIVPRFINYLVLVPFYTRIFVDQAEYGVISELYAYMVVLLVILTYGMETAYFRFARKQEDADTVFSTSVISLLTTGILFFGVVWIWRKEIAQLLVYPDHVEYVLLFSAIVAIDAFCAIPFARLRQQNKALKFSIIKIINVVVIVVSVLFLLYWAPKQAGSKENYWIEKIYHPEVDVVYVFIGNLAGSLVTLFILIGEVCKIRWKFNWIMWKRMISYSFPLLVAGLAGTLNDAMDKMALKRLLTDQETAMKQLGIYSANYKIAVLMSLFIQMFRFALEPFFFEKSKEKNAGKAYADVMKYFVITSLILFLGINLYINIIKHIIPVSYQGALGVVPIITFGYLLYGIFVNLSVWYKINDLTKYGAWITLSGAVVTILINVLLIPVYGYYASAWAHVASYGLMVLISYFMGKQKYPVPYEVVKILKYIAIAVGLYLIWKFIPVKNVMIESILSTLIIAVFIIYAIKKDNIQRIFMK
ncbi:MAG TPA: polysaccharide biosynthesis protein [Bacteroidetes bacterium]|mgnify:CR=1 FL=1|nr:polysaccharide biosynthesis protein [Bacteroidota bacterium]